MHKLMYRLIFVNQIYFLSILGLSPPYTICCWHFKNGIICSHP